MTGRRPTRPPVVAIGLALVLGVCAVVASVVVPAVRTLTGMRTDIGQASQRTTVRPVPGGVAVDIVVTPDQPWPSSVQVVRQDSDGQWHDASGRLTPLHPGSRLEDAAVDGHPLSGDGDAYAAVPTRGSEPLHITGIVRPYTPGRRAVWAGSVVSGLRLRTQTVTIEGTPISCLVQTGWYGFGHDYALMTPCPPSPLTLTPTTIDGTRIGAVARIEY